MKLKRSLETETFVSQGGFYTIKQEDFLGEEQWVSLTPSQMRKVIRNMREWLKDTSWFNEVEED